MKVYIGKYKNWVGPYQVTDWMRRFLSKERVDKIAEALPMGPFEWVRNARNRKIKIRIDHYDVWSMDHTLAYIIHPMLIKMKEDKHGAPFVDDVDVPVELRSDAPDAVPSEDGSTDSYFFQRWDWVLDQMIYSFSALLNDDLETPFFTIDKNGNHLFDREGYEKEHSRVQNGLVLFGKYYRSLWT